MPSARSCWIVRMGEDYVMEPGTTWAELQLRRRARPHPASDAQLRGDRTATGWYHIEAPESGSRTGLSRSASSRSRGGMSRRSVARMNAALQSMVATRR